MKKIRIIQIGITHEHASGKLLDLRKMPETFDLLGYVDDRDFCHTPHYTIANADKYEGLKRFSFEEVLSMTDLDAVLVEVPNNDLVPVALKCMERGLAMHVDKPAGEDLVQYRKLLDGCEKRGLPFQMGYMYRGNPALKFCRKAYREGWLGEITEIESDMNHCYGDAFYDEYIGRFSGGIMWNLGCHVIDFIVSLLGRPQKVTPFLHSAPGFPETVRNNCTAVLEYPHAIATVKACCHAPQNTQGRRMKISGTLGTIEFAPVEIFGSPRTVQMVLAKDVPGYAAGRHEVEIPAIGNRYVPQLEEFAAMIRGEWESSYSFEHDYIVHETTLAASGYLNINRKDG